MEVINNYTDQQLEGFTTELKYAAFCAQVILGATGILGNALVCVTIARAKFMHNFTNFLIAHMAVADLFVCVSLVTFQERYMADNINVDTAKQGIFCQLFHGKMIVWFSCDISVLGMVCVTAERYLGIVHPLKYPRLVTKTRVGITIAVVWSIAIVIKIPQLTTQTTVTNSGAKPCFSHGQSGATNTLVFLGGLLEFYVPAAILLWCYIKIMISLRRGADNWRRENNPAPADELLTARRRVVKVLLIVAWFYLVIWIPVHAIFIVNFFHQNLSATTYNILTALQPTIAVANSVVNPFVYAFKYKEFQRGVRHVFLFCRRRERMADAVGIEMTGLKKK